MTPADPAPPMRPLPALEPATRFYWTAGGRGGMEICRCGACGRYVHPPVPRCTACGGEAPAPAPVSGRGRVATFTVNVQPWLPGLEVPYVIAAIELEEQAGLYVFSNIVGIGADEVRIGMPVAVTFEQHGEIHLPLFRPADKEAVNRG